jgi:uncharacterized membrane protein YtjA (UPF0391 family)
MKDKVKLKMLDFLTFLTIAIVALIFGYADTTRAALLVDRTIFYVSTISAAASLLLTGRKRA